MSSTLINNRNLKPSRVDKTESATAFSHFPASNTAAVITLAAPTSPERWALFRIEGGYDGAPTAGTLTIAQGSGPTSCWKVPITGAGAFAFDWTECAKRFVAGKQVVITLAAGGSGVTGFINCDAAIERDIG